MGRKRIEKELLSSLNGGKWKGHFQKGKEILGRGEWEGECIKGRMGREDLEGESGREDNEQKNM